MFCTTSHRYFSWAGVYALVVLTLSVGAVIPLAEVRVDPWAPTPEPREYAQTPIHIGAYATPPLSDHVEQSKSRQSGLVERLATGIEKLKVARDGGWWHCGEFFVDKHEVHEKALLVAVHITRVSASREINPWGVAGTIANESWFDPCALGIGPRKWAVANGILPKNRLSISYSAEQVLSVVNSQQARRRFRKTGFDLGLCQILTRYYHGPPSNMLTVGRGTEICVDEMRSRAARNRTDRPWLYWRGSKTRWYDAKITHFSRKMGAQRWEI